MEKESQKKKVLHWLDRYGTITNWDAVTELHIMCLPKRIEELRKEGYNIVTHYVYVEGGKYGMYELMDEEGEALCQAN